MKSEKLTINFTPTELGQMDFLTARGLYSSRSDLVRSAVLTLLQKHEPEIREYLKPAYEEAKTGGVRNWWCLGIESVSGKSLQELKSAGAKAAIKVIGVLAFDGDVSPELVAETLASVKVYGRIIASVEVKKAIERL